MRRRGPALETILTDAPVEVSLKRLSRGSTFFRPSVETDGDNCLSSPLAVVDDPERLSAAGYVGALEEDGMRFFQSERR